MAASTAPARLVLRASRVPDYCAGGGGTATSSTRRERCRLCCCAVLCSCCLALGPRRRVRLPIAIEKRCDMGGNGGVCEMQLRAHHGWARSEKKWGFHKAVERHFPLIFLAIPNKILSKLDVLVYYRLVTSRYRSSLTTTPRRGACRPPTERLRLSGSPFFLLVPRSLVPLTCGYVAAGAFFFRKMGPIFLEAPNLGRAHKN